MKNGDKLHIGNGPFKGFEGKLLRQEGDNLFVEVVAFGRKIEITISPLDIEDSKRAAERDALCWRRRLAEEWWSKRCSEEEAPKAA